MCLHCGYPQGLGQLVSANTDYIVDALCRCGSSIRVKAEGSIILNEPAACLPYICIPSGSEVYTRSSLRQLQICLLCRQLRELDLHPRAPQLMAALLSQAGVVPQLLPLMAEPLQAALRVRAILPSITDLPYLYPLKCIFYMPSCVVDLTWI